MKRILIAGILGGLGLEVAKRLARENCLIAGIDNLNPQSASEAHIKMQLEILEGLNGSEGFSETDNPLEQPVNADQMIQLFPIDIRNAKEVTKVLQNFKPGFIVHCITPRSFNSDDSTFVKLEPVSGIVEINIWEDYYYRFKIIPLFIGKGQSPVAFPMRQILQKISRINPYLNPDEEMNLIPLSKAADLLVDEVVSKPVKTLSNEQNKRFNNTNLLEQLEAISETVNTKKVSELCEFLLDGIERELEYGVVTNEASEKFASDLQQGILKEIIDLVKWAVELPYTPPLNWPKRLMKKGKR